MASEESPNPFQPPREPDEPLEPTVCLFSFYFLERSIVALSMHQSKVRQIRQMFTSDGMQQPL